MRSGAESVLLRILTAARADGWSVELLTPDGPLVGQAEAGEIATRPLADLKMPPGPRPWAAGVVAARSIPGARTLRRAAREADVVLVNGILALPAVAAARIDRPVVWLVHDVIHRADWRFVMRTTGRAVDLCVAVSEAVASPLRSVGLAVTVVPNGTVWPVDRAPVAVSDPPVVGCAAMLTSWKGQDILLDAAARIERPDVRFELAGGQFPKDASYVAGLHRMAEAPALRDRVRFLGHVDGVLDRVRSWRVSVIPSVDPEASPLTLLEAMSVGVPAVATDHGGAPEVIGDAGLLVEPRDATALAQAITGLLDDPDLWLRCADAGPARIEALYTLQVQQERMLALLSARAGRR